MTFTETLVLYFRYMMFKHTNINIYIYFFPSGTFAALYYYVYVWWSNRPLREREIRCCMIYNIPTALQPCWSTYYTVDFVSFAFAGYSIAKLCLKCFYFIWGS